MSYPGPVSPWTTVATNYTVSTVSCTSYPAPGTYIGTVITNTGPYYANHSLPSSGCYYPGTLVPSSGGRWNYSSITGYTYTNAPTYTFATFTTNSTYVTNVYDFVLHANTEYSYDPGFSGKKVRIEGPNVTLVLRNGLDGTESFTWNIGATLLLYAGGPSASVSGWNCLNSNSWTASFVLYCAPSVTSFTFNGNGPFTGVIVAPNADARLNGGGNDNEDFCGAIMCNSVQLNGHFSFHFDESLREQYTVVDTGRAHHGFRLHNRRFPILRRWHSKLLLRRRGVA